MIISFPTGLYRTVLPSERGPGNVTYTISSGPPPSTPVRAIQLPVAERLRPLPPTIFDQEQRRAGYGELVFTVAKAGRSNPGSNTKQFEVGEVLEFDDDPTVGTPVLPIESDIEIQHNTNVLDLAATGLTEEEINQVVLESERRQRELEKAFSVAEAEFQNLNVAIRENNKAINETNKAIRAVRVAFNLPETGTSDNEILTKLLDRQAELRAQREQLISDQNAKAVEVDAARQNLIRVSQLVR